MSLSRRHCLRLAAAAAGCAALTAAARPSRPLRWSAPGEFEPQDYIWLSWVESGFLGSAAFSTVALEVMKAITPQVRVRLLHSDEVPGPGADGAAVRRLPPAEAAARLRSLLGDAGVDLARVELFYHPRAFGAIQDPGPFFLRFESGGLALADYRFDHPDPRSEAIDRDLASQLGLPTIPSQLVSEGGGRQSNGRGTLLLVQSVEQARNPTWKLEDIEREHLRVHGARKVVWLEQGPAEEEWGRLADGRWGIGTGGHVDVFARFADSRTVLLAEVSPSQRDQNPIAADTHRRMERNYQILREAKDQDGKSFRILRVPVPDPLLATADFDNLSKIEQSWFEGAQAGEKIEYYLPAGYLNFIIANGIVVTARLFEEGRPEKYREQDRLAKEALKQAFPNRQIVQVGVTPLLHDGAGLHCHSRNQPAA